MKKFKVNIKKIAKFKNNYKTSKLLAKLTKISKKKPNKLALQDKAATAMMVKMGMAPDQRIKLIYKLA